jgi:hypothetical protein
MTEVFSYDSDTGYYRETPSSDIRVELSDPQQSDHQEELIAVPWDDDNFSLCLDTFPSSRLARTKYNQYPTTASPLRNHWGLSSSFSSEEAIMDDKHILRALNDTSPPGLVDIETRSTCSKGKDKKSTGVATLNKAASNRDIVAGDVFPYKNNSNFLTRINSKKKPTRIITEQQNIQCSSSSSMNTKRVEHISPLSNSSIILQNENDIFNQVPISPKPSLVHKVSNASVKSKFSIHSGISFSTAIAAVHRQQQYHSQNQQKYSNSKDCQFSDSQYSDSGESWKVVQRKYNSSAITVMPSTPPMSCRTAADQQYQVTLSRSYSSLTNRHQQDDYVSTRSTKSPFLSNKQFDGKHSALHYSNSLSSSVEFYTPQASPAPSVITRSGSESMSYQSIVVPKNPDKLVFYLEDKASSHYTPSVIKNRNSTYSQVFDPAYNGKRKKSYRKRVSAGIFTKLMKNLKQHFIKPANN